MACENRAKTGIEYPPRDVVVWKVERGQGEATPTHPGPAHPGLLSIWPHLLLHSLHFLLHAQLWRSG